MSQYLGHGYKSVIMTWWDERRVSVVFSLLCYKS